MDSHQQETWLHASIGHVHIPNYNLVSRRDSSHIDSFREEYARHSQEFQKIVVAGDCNIHHRPWLLFSNGNIPEGEFMKNMFDELCLCQYVR